jgi:outer membrane protein assembly factor BamB
MRLMPGRAVRLAVTAAAALALASPVTSGAETPAAVPSVPIPQDPSADAVAPFLGAPRPARPIPGARFAPRHPYMAANDRSNLHDDAYQSDAGRTPGPLGFDPQVTSTLYTQECASVTFDRQGRILTVCVGLATVDLRLLDPRTLDLLADFPLGPRPVSSVNSPFTAFGGGGYFYLDNHDRVVVPTSDGHIDVISETDGPLGPGLGLVRSYDVSSHVGNSVILSVLPDWSGRLWFVTGSGVVGVVDPRTGKAQSRQLPGETIGNSFAVDETGGVFVVSDRALYRFDATAKGAPGITWRKPYDGGTRQKPGQSQRGSGTTPTLVRRDGRHYVTITDNADPRMHVLVFRADRRGPGRRPLCSAPVFAPNKGSTDNSLIAVGNAIIVENNYGYTGPQERPPSSTSRGTPTTEPGVTRIDVDYTHGRCRVAWANKRVRVPTSVSKVSSATGLVYVYEHPAADEVRYRAGQEPDSPEDPWYLTALDVRTGKRVWSVLTGVGLGYNNNYAPITFGPDGTAYIGTLGGLVAVRDQS